MNTVDIRTSQNVVIEYELGGLGERILAFIIDIVIVWSAYGLLYILIVNSFGRDVLEVLYYILLYPMVACYTLISEVLMNGQTLGKKAMNLKAIKLNGRETGINDFMIRWAFRMVDIWFSLGMVASLLISSADKNQRLGDTLSDMVVVKLRPRRQFTLKNILQIQKAKDYSVSYPMASLLNDEEMLLVKSTLSRNRRFKNKAHREAMNDLVKVISLRLGIDAPKDQTRFLKTLLEDYIVLTR